jgi:hypothetical protein
MSNIDNDTVEYKSCYSKVELYDTTITTRYCFECGLEIPCICDDIIGYDVNTGLWIVNLDVGCLIKKHQQDQQEKEGQQKLDSYFSRQEDKEV